jgi:hypothetical protein
MWRKGGRRKFDVLYLQKASCLSNFSSAQRAIQDMVCYTHALVRWQQVSRIKAQLLSRWTLTAIQTRNQESVGLFVPGEPSLAGFALLKMIVSLFRQSFSVESNAYKLLVCGGY